MVSELDDIFKSGYYESPLGSDNLHWYVNEVIRLESKMAFYFENTKKDIVMKKDDEEVSKKIFVEFVRRILNLIKLEITVT